MLPMDAIWYEIPRATSGVGGSVNLAYAVKLERYCPAAWGPGANTEGYTFIEVTWPVNDRYSRATQIVFSGTFEEVTAELERIRGLLPIPVNI